jgi:hypothetical protein
MKIRMICSQSAKARYDFSAHDCEYCCFEELKLLAFANCINPLPILLSAYILGTPFTTLPTV